MLALLVPRAIPVCELRYWIGLSVQSYCNNVLNTVLAE
jgi:hypothetical protein